jgi:exodeoxyribonuclease V gamma subunit
MIDERILDQCVGAIESIATSVVNSDPVPYEIACELATARIAEVESRRAQFTRGGVAVGSLSALRSLPFRVIFVLAMNENGFPERSRHDPLDLRLARRSAGDVTAAERDRYLFLETLLAARDRIFMSYVSRDPQTGDPLEPSTLIRELQFILRGYLDEQTLEGLTIEHPMSRYDRHYFADLDSCNSRPHQQLTSFDPIARRGARMAALRKNLADYCGDVPLPGRDERLLDQLAPDVRNAVRRSLRISDPPLATGKQIGAPPELRLSLAALRRFLECPLQGAARYALKMAEDDQGAGEDRDDEPLAQSVLDRTVLLRGIFRAARGDRQLAIGEYARAFRIAQAQGRAPVGTFAERAEKVDIQQLHGWFDQAREAGAGALADWQEIRLGRADEFERADRILPEIALSVNVRRSDGGLSSQTLKIHGSVGLVSPDFDTSLLCTLRKGPKVRDFLDLFLRAIALAAAGEARQPVFRAIVLAATGAGATERSKSFRPPSREDALKYLAALASDLLSGENHYFLPIEAVKEIWPISTEPEAKADLLDPIYELRENEFQRCSSDYGPVRNARRFEPPSASRVREIVLRRFGPLAEVFES